MTRRSRSLSGFSLVAATVACLVVALAAAPAPAGAAVTFGNSVPITVPDPKPCGDALNPGVASPYPSSATVSGLLGTVTDVDVTLRNVTTPFTGDLEVLLVGPGGGSQNLMLLSDAGDEPLTSIPFVTFDDAAAAPAPQTGAWNQVTIKPTNYTEATNPDTFPAPAPAPSANTTLAGAFNGIDPNGSWKLYVTDDACPDGNSTIAAGWTLAITTNVPSPSTTTLTSSINPSKNGQPVTFKATVTSPNNRVTHGKVSFTDGATTLAANVPVNGSGVATFTTSALAFGDHVVKATYNGLPDFSSSSATVTQHVDPAPIVIGKDYCNTGPITINASGPASPYPSNIVVAGTATALTKVTAGLYYVTHPFEEDIEVLLVSPAGEKVVLVSDAGRDGAANQVTLFLDDAAASPLPQDGAWAGPGSTITRKPTNYDDGSVDVFDPFGTIAPSTPLLSAFNGTNPNGTWKLYVVDDAAPDGGSIAGGWCLHLDGIAPTLSLPALVRTSTTWLLRESLSTGAADTTFTYGNKPLAPLMGDWNGDGLDTAGSFENGVFKLRNTNTTGTTPDITFTFGDPRGFPLSGDFNHDGTDDVAVYRNGLWQVRYSTGTVVPAFTFGSGSWPATVPLAGDWDGDGTDGIGTYTYSTATWQLRNGAGAGSPDIGPFVFGTPNSSYPVTGDWDADGDDSVGAKTAGTWTLRNANSAGGADRTFDYGLANDLPLSWHKP